MLLTNENSKNFADEYCAVSPLITPRSFEYPKQMFNPLPRTYAF